MSHQCSELTLQPLCSFVSQVLIDRGQSYSCGPAWCPVPILLSILLLLLFLLHDPIWSRQRSVHLEAGSAPRFFLLLTVGLLGLHFRVWSRPALHEKSLDTTFVGIWHYINNGWLAADRVMTCQFSLLPIIQSQIVLIDYTLIEQVAVGNFFGRSAVCKTEQG